MVQSKSLVKIAAALMITGTTCLVSVAATQTAHAQNSMSSGEPMQNVIPQSEEATLQAKITHIDQSTRAVTLKGQNGDKVTVTAGPNVRLEMLKAGQTVNAQYFRSVAFLINPPQGGTGVPVSSDQFSQVTARPVTAPGGVAVQVVKVSGTVVGIDLSNNRLRSSIRLAVRLLPSTLPIPPVSPCCPS